MATSSIFNSIDLKTEDSCKRLINAMESSAEARPKKVDLCAKVIEPTDNEIKQLFKEK